MQNSVRLLTQEQQLDLLAVLKDRHQSTNQPDPNIQWNHLEAKLLENPAKLWSLFQMERTGGEPCVVEYNPQTSEYLFFDCSPESPAGRRNLCYDRKALETRKQHKPKNSVLDTAEEMGIQLLTESQYRQLQQLGEFDTKTSSWVVTPEPVRQLGGALFCDRRYNQVFVYHNGAESYYSSRGFRGLLRV